MPCSTTAFTRAVYRAAMPRFVGRFLSLFPEHSSGESRNARCSGGGRFTYSNVVAKTDLLICHDLSPNVQPVKPSPGEAKCAGSCALLSGVTRCPVSPSLWLVLRSDIPSTRPIIAETHIACDRTTFIATTVQPRLSWNKEGRRLAAQHKPLGAGHAYRRTDSTRTDHVDVSFVIFASASPPIAPGRQVPARPAREQRSLGRSAGVPESA